MTTIPDTALSENCQWYYVGRAKSQCSRRFSSFRTGICAEFMAFHQLPSEKPWFILNSPRLRPEPFNGKWAIKSFLSVLIPGSLSVGSTIEQSPQILSYSWLSPWRMTNPWAKDKNIFFELLESKRSCGRHNSSLTDIPNLSIQSPVHTEYLYWASENLLAYGVILKNLCQ